MRCFGWLFGLGQIVTVISVYHSYAALGDSYAAGDGAGSSNLLPHLDLGCARFSGAYPVQIANSPEINITTFRNLACGGGLTFTVRTTQVPRIGDSDVITIQVGGNEVDFFELLNECVQQWLPFSNCERELARARGLVESTGFMDRFDRLVTTAKRTVKSDARLLFLGYARFFNTSTKQCNHVSFSSKHPETLLKQDMRIKFNEIVLLLNDVIRAFAEAHGATYVDIDDVFEGHRFCEEGIIEPSPDASWFFSDVGRGEDKNKDLSDNSFRRQMFPNPFKEFLNFTKTFHPTIEGHTAIAKEIIRILQDGQS